MDNRTKKAWLEEKIHWINTRLIGLYNGLIDILRFSFSFYLGSLFYTYALWFFFWPDGHPITQWHVCHLNHQKLELPKGLLSHLSKGQKV
jgi:hypothetical protein